MELRIKVNVNNMKDLKEKIENIRKIEEEYNCTCTLLDVEITH